MLSLIFSCTESLKKRPRKRSRRTMPTKLKKPKRMPYKEVLPLNSLEMKKTVKKKRWKDLLLMQAVKTPLKPTHEQIHLSP